MAFLYQKASIDYNSVKHKKILAWAAFHILHLIGLVSYGLLAI